MRSELEENGYTIREEVYSKEEVGQILKLIADNKIEQKFGVREFLIDHPEIAQKVFTERMLAIVKEISPACDKSIKSIYFDKPPSANWLVNWHQDLTINVEGSEDIEGYSNWRVQADRTIVQPDVQLLESTFTIRIHLDDCKKDNGALRVIEKSHTLGVIEINEWVKIKHGVEKICEVRKGGVVIMKPLILHSSKRTENQEIRRVIHVEFTANELPPGLKWKEEVKF